MRFHSPTGALIVVAAVMGCAEASSETSPSATTAGFSELFDEVARIELQELAFDPVSRITWMDVSSDGRIALVDPGLAKVRVYTPEGRLLETIGSRGSGPGEFNSVIDLSFADDGSLYVADFVPPRITRYSPQLELDTVFRIDGVEGAHRIDVRRDRVLLQLFRRIPGAAKFEWFTTRGESLGRFHPEHPLISEIPYWRSASSELFAMDDEHVYVANKIIYPIYRYAHSGELIDSMGTRPKSWTQASRLEPGQFSSPHSRLTFEQWMRTFTRIDRLAIGGDSLLFVSHERLDPSELAYREGTYTLDIYETGGRKLYEDVQLPGRMVAKGDGFHLYILIGVPPEPWTLGKYRLRGGSEEG